MDGINVDAEALIGLFSNNAYSGISDTASSYNDEWKTIGAIADAFSSIKDASQGFEMLKSSASSYANEGIETDDPNKAPDIYGAQSIGLDEQQNKVSFNEKIANQLDACAVNNDDDAARNLIGSFSGEDKEAAVSYYNSMFSDGKNHVGEVPSSMDPQYSQGTAKQYEPKPVKTATVNTNSGDLNVRTKPNGQVIKSIPKDSTVTVVKDDGSGWVEVKLEDGTTGVVSSKYLDINDNSNKILVNPNVKIENLYGNYKTDSLTKKDVFTSEDATKIDDYISNNKGDIALKYIDEKFVGDAKDTANQYTHEKLGR